MKRHLLLTLEVRRLLRTKQEREGVPSLQQIIACVTVILFFTRQCLLVVDFVIIIVFILYECVLVIMWSICTYQHNNITMNDHGMIKYICLKL